MRLKSRHTATLKSDQLSESLRKSMVGICRHGCCWRLHNRLFAYILGVPTEMLAASGAAASIGLINAVGNLGGFTGPYAIGYLRTTTNSFMPGLLFLSASMLLSGVTVLMVKAHSAEMK